MSEKLFYPQEKLSNEAHIKSMDYYYKEYKRSIEDQNKFWEEKASRLNWYCTWDSVGSFDYSKGDIKLSACA